MPSFPLDAPVAETDAAPERLGEIPARGRSILRKCPSVLANPRPGVVAFAPIKR